MLLRIWLAGLFVTTLLFGGACSFAAEKPPNVILIMTDDQGYGDVGFHGNKMIQTPNLDALARQSIRLTNFHVDPTCAETRSALMTGRYSCRTGVWHTVLGRSLLRRDETTMANVFANAGYQTGIFGKWHLGDGYPFRPGDRGFHESLVLGGGGVMQIPDAWGNDYFDDDYSRRGKPEKQQGYCTDVFFSAATKFIEANRKAPFFCYIATNAPHSPYNVDPKYAKPYVDQGVPQPMANFYGMIANIDENLGKLLARLKELEVEDNTFVIFMTDNGSAAGTEKPANKGAWKGYSAGMKAQKGSQYEGGHRVPFFLRVPKGAAGVSAEPREINRLAAHFDVLPTLIELCGMKTPNGVKFDGTSLLPLLANPSIWPERTLFVHSQRVDVPEKWRKCSVMTDRWRLVDGKELYDLPADPGQSQDVAEKHAEVVARLRGEYEKWWESVSPRFGEYCEYVLGSDKQNPLQLSCHDWHSPPGQIFSQQEQLTRNPVANGFWAVEIERAGRYQFTLRNRPAGTPGKLTARHARIRVGDIEARTEVAADTPEAVLTLDLSPGKTRLQTWLADADGVERGAFFVVVKRL
jgi:arylsulfatase A-like enzyme